MFCSGFLKLDEKSKLLQLLNTSNFLNRCIVHFLLASLDSEKPCMELTVWIVEPESIHHVLLGVSTKNDSWHTKDMTLPFFSSHFLYFRQSFFICPSFLQKKHLVFLFIFYCHYALCVFSSLARHSCPS